MKAWTDYPLCRACLVQGSVLDEPGVKAPVREVEVVGWDGDKYARVAFEGSTYVFKVGYLYILPGRCGDVPTINTKELPVLKDVYMHELNVPMLLDSIMEDVIASAMRNIPSKKRRLDFYQDVLKSLAKHGGWEDQLDCSAIDDVFDDAVCLVHPELAEAIEEDRSRRAYDDEMEEQSYEEYGELGGDGVEEEDDR